MLRNIKRTRVLRQLRYSPPVLVLTRSWLYPITPGYKPILWKIRPSPPNRSSTDCKMPRYPLQSIIHAQFCGHVPCTSILPVPPAYTIHLVVLNRLKTILLSICQHSQQQQSNLDGINFNQPSSESIAQSSSEATIFLLHHRYSLEAIAEMNTARMHQAGRE